MQDTINIKIKILEIKTTMSQNAVDGINKQLGIANVNINCLGDITITTQTKMIQ